MWTLDELAERVREALEAEYPGAPNGRVRDVPDRRAIRWYSTIGLVDRPLGMRGRSALYGPRHLEQLVAIKRRQAQGYSLAQIQEELTGLSPSSLADIAHVPPRLLVQIEPSPDEAPARPRFWADRPAPAEAPQPGLPLTSTTIVTSTDRPPPHTQPFTGVALGGGVLLLVPHPLSERDRDAVAEAAQPLLALLAARGLTSAEGLIDGSPS